MAPQRKKQQLKRKKPEKSGTENLVVSISDVPVNIAKLLGGAEEFIEIGRRSLEEVAIHKELQSRGHRIKYLVSSEITDVNPLIIHLERAKDLEKYDTVSSEATPALQVSNSEDLAQATPAKPRIYTQKSNHLVAEVVVRRESDIRISVDNPVNIPQLSQSLNTAISDIQGFSAHRSTATSLSHHTATIAPLIQKESSEIPRPIGLENQEIREIILNNQKIQYRVEDIKWPTSAVTFKDDIPRLFREWTSSSVVSLKGIPVPMKDWSKLYHRVNSESWKVLKKIYSDSSIIMSIFDMYNNEAAFWEALPGVFVKKNGKDRPVWQRVLKRCKDIRTEIDKADAAEARKQFGDEFEAKFSYSKGGKRVIMSDTTGIARKYREYSKCPRPWDI